MLSENFTNTSRLKLIALIFFFTVASFMTRAVYEWIATDANWNDEIKALVPLLPLFVFHLVFGAVTEKVKQLLFYAVVVGVLITSFIYIELYFDASQRTEELALIYYEPFPYGLMLFAFGAFFSFILFFVGKLIAFVFNVIILSAFSKNN